MSQEESAARQERLLAEQACANAIFRKQWHEAIMLALQLEQVCLAFFMSSLCIPEWWYPS